MLLLLKKLPESCIGAQPLNIEENLGNCIQCTYPFLKPKIKYQTFAELTSKTYLLHYTDECSQCYNRMKNYELC